MPFESADPRILKKWCSNKLALDRFNTADLINMLNKYKIKMGTNFLIGFPDETREEMETTLNFARYISQLGLYSVQIGLVMPVPGTPIFKYCIENGHLPKDYNPDRFQWTKAQLAKTQVPPKELETIRDKAWEEFNSDEFKKLKKSWVAATPVS